MEEGQRPQHLTAQPHCRLQLVYLMAAVVLVDQLQAWTQARSSRIAGVARD